MQLGRGGAGTDTQICLTLVPAAIPRPHVLFPQVPHLWPLLQPGGVGQQAPGPCGYSPGGCADEAGGGGMAYIFLCVCVCVSHSFPGSRGSREETELEMASLSVAAQPEVGPLKIWGGWY